MKRIYHFLLSALVAEVASQPASLVILEPSVGSVYLADSTGRANVLVVATWRLDISSAESLCVEFDSQLSCLPFGKMLDAMADRMVHVKGVLVGHRSISVRAQASNGTLLASASCSFQVRGSSVVGIDLTAVSTGGLAGTEVSPWSIVQSQYAEMDRTHARALYFDAVYNTGFWLGAPLLDSSFPTSMSGRGSHVDVTNPAREALAEVISRYRVPTVLDIPCGDLNWLSFAGPAVLGSASYLGADVSPVLIHQNKARFPGWQFVEADAVEGPELSALWSRAAKLHHEVGEVGARPGLILSRHMMYHLPPLDNIAALRRFERSGAALLLLTTHFRANENNASFTLAKGHSVNLFRSPYCLRDPLRLYPDNAPDTFLGLWALPPAYPESERAAVPPLMNPRQCLN